MTEADFIRAVAAEPDDDTVRLAFADWLDEHGRPGRAQFVRVQVERARLDEFDPRQSELFAAEQRLLVEHADDIIGRFHGVEDFRLRRGLVEMVQGTAALLAHELGEMCAQSPIREIRLTGMTESGLGAKLGALKELARIERLEINDLKGDRHELDETDALLKSKNWQKVRGITLVTGIRREGFLALLDRPAFAGLREIRLNGFEADSLVDAIAERPELPVELIAVHHNRMGECSLTNEGLQKLANTPHWARLRDLDVGACPMGYDWAKYEHVLPKSGLRRLVLRAPSMNVGLAGDCNGVLRAASWGKVESFGFHNMLFDSKNLEKLRNHPSAGQLKSLHVTSSRMRGATLDVLFTSPGLSNLRRFICDADCNSAVLASPEAAPMANLVELGMGMAGEAAAAVANSPHLGRLRKLDGNTDKLAVAKAIATSTHLPALNWLSLGCGDRFSFDPATAKALATNPALPNLGLIEVYGGKWDEKNLTPLLESARSWVRLDTRRVADEALKQKARERMMRAKVHQPPTDECRETDWYPD